MNITFILLSVFLNGTAQILLKLGMTSVNFKDSHLNIIFSIFTNIYILGGLFVYGISIILWMYVLSKVEVSFAYPFLSLGFIFVMLTGMFFLGETVSLYKILGMCFIIIGIFFIYKFGN